MSKWSENCIQTTRCCKCKSYFTCKGRPSKSYNQATTFIKRGDRWRPVCSDKEGCASRVSAGTPKEFLWVKGKEVSDAQLS